MPEYIVAPSILPFSPCHIMKEKGMNGLSYKVSVYSKDTQRTYRPLAMSFGLV